MILSGAGDDVIDAGAGNDTIDGGAGSDTIQAGAGDDRIIYDANDANVDGGAGDDTLVISGDINLTSIDKFTSIETIDMTNMGDDSLTLTLADVLDMTEAPDHALNISDDSGDSLTVDTTGWTKTSEVDNGDNTTTYTYSGDNNTVHLTIDNQIDTMGM